MYIKEINKTLKRKEKISVLNSQSGENKYVQNFLFFRGGDNAPDYRYPWVGRLVYFRGKITIELM